MARRSGERVTWITPTTIFTFYHVSILGEKKILRMYKYIFGVYSLAAPQQSTGFNMGGEEYGWGTFSFCQHTKTCPFSCR